MGDRKASRYPSLRFRHRPTEIEGIFYDGSPSNAKAIVAWGRARSGGSTPFEIFEGDLHMYTRQGARYVPDHDLAVLGVLGEPYSIQPAVLAVAYQPVNGDAGYGAPLPAERVRELVAEAAQCSDRDRLRQIVAQLGAHCEAAQGG